MYLFSYQVFLKIYESGSLLKAAEQLNLTPSAVSHSIASLEKEFGLPLFLRDRSGVKLTKSGEELLPYLRSVLNAEEHLRQNLSHMQGLKKGTVRIGTFNSVCVNWIPDIVTTFKKQYPTIDIVIQQGGYSDVINWIKDYSIDMGFVSTPVTENLEVTPLVKDPIVCVTPKDYFPPEKSEVTVDDLRNQNMILQRDDYGKETSTILEKYKISPNSQYYSIDDSSITALVESGLGFSLLTKLIMKKIMCNVDVYPLSPDEYRTIGIATLGKHTLSPAALKMFQHILEYVA